VDANEVVVHKVERDRRDVVLDLLGESVCEASEAPHVHPHRKVLAFDIGRADVFRVRLATDFLPLATDALGRTVACFSVAPRAVNFYEHGVVDFGAKRTHYQGPGSGSV